MAIDSDLTLELCNFQSGVDRPALVQQHPDRRAVSDVISVFNVRHQPLSRPFNAAMDISADDLRSCVREFLAP